MSVHLEQHFTLGDRIAVEHFLRAHPRILPLLDALSALIPAYFSGASLYLRVVDTAPTGDAPDGRRLVLFIATDLGFEEAMGRLDRLMEAWRPDVRAKSSVPFSVDVALGMTSAAIDAAAQRFSRTHGDGYKAHGAVARRFLHAAPGSDAEALARAELAATLAQAQGGSLSDCGGDVAAVRARLRDEHP